MLNKTTHKPAQAQRGNTMIIGLAAVLIVALAAGAYFSGIFENNTTEAQAAEVASANAPAAGDAKQDEKKDEKKDDKKADESAGLPEGIKPGNPVVAKVDGKDVTRADVLGFIQNLSPQARQMPINQLFPMALDQVVNAQIINEKVAKTSLESDPAVTKELEIAKKQIVRSVFMEKEAEKATTDDMLKAAYEEYTKKFPKMDEIKARHILVKDEKQAKDILKQLEGGADFAELAKKYSIDATKDKGGELNYFVKEEVVPAFGTAVFKMKKGEVTKAPVKSDFGYHIVEAARPGHERNREEMAR
jgi:peptidyl-prolyl cis-trans isomerase C